MARFFGFRLDSGCRVLMERDDGILVWLDPRRDVEDHSPAGFGWGYQGAGPAQLSLALICATAGVPAARKYHLGMVLELVSSLPSHAWELNAKRVISYIQQERSIRFPEGDEGDGSNGKGVPMV